MKKYSGLPVCAMRERVNRYVIVFRNILTALEIYGILFLEDSAVFIPGLATAALVAIKV